MTILPIRLLGDPVLRTPSLPVTMFNVELQQLIADMFETMDAVEGVGLAAPQIGVGQQIFTYSIDGDRGHVINPQIINQQELQEEQNEGCLSVPGLAFPPPRYQYSTVTGVDQYGEAVQIKAEGLLARCFQHETDHLAGKLFIDRLEGDYRSQARQAVRQAEFQDHAQAVQQQRGNQTSSSFGAFS